MGSGIANSIGTKIGIGISTGPGIGTDTGIGIVISTCMRICNGLSTGTVIPTG
jgi:hypothetical protein